MKQIIGKTLKEVLRKLGQSSKNVDDDHWIENDKRFWWTNHRRTYHEKHFVSRDSLNWSKQKRIQILIFTLWTLLCLLQEDVHQFITSAMNISITHLQPRLKVLVLLQLSHSIHCSVKIVDVLYIQLNQHSKLLNEWNFYYQNKSSMVHSEHHTVSNERKNRVYTAWMMTSAMSVLVFQPWILFSRFTANDWFTANID